jgi:GTP-binding protein EngB required for normal cell division
MIRRTKAAVLLTVAILLLVVPYCIVFGVGSVWMWKNGWGWFWALGTGLPTIISFALLEWARRIFFPKAVDLPHPPTTSTPTGGTAKQAIQNISQRLQAENPPLDQPEVLEKTIRDVLEQVLDVVAKQYYPEAEHPVLQVPLVHIAGVVELVARDFRQMFAENVPGGNQLTLSQLYGWKKKGELGWQIGLYLWQLNRIRRLCMRPGTAIVQEIQDHCGQNVAGKSLDGLKRWAIDYCVTKTGDYAIQLYSGDFIRDEEYRPRISLPASGALFDQEPLQVLVIGQVKAGKSSLINALIGKPEAPVDAVPLTDRVDLYECEPGGLAPMILRDTPGYGDVGGKNPWDSLAHEIQQCDLLIMVCTAQSAARKADRDLLQKIHAYYQQHPKLSMPPVVYVVTHIDRVGESLTSELAMVVAEDLDVAPPEIAVVCTAAGQTSHLDRVLAAIQANLTEAQRLKCCRCIRQIRQEQDDDKVLRQILNGLRLTGGWLVRKP